MFLRTYTSSCPTPCSSISVYSSLSHARVSELLRPKFEHYVVSYLVCETAGNAGASIASVLYLIGRVLLLYCRYSITQMKLTDLFLRPPKVSVSRL